MLQALILEDDPDNLLALKVFAEQEGFHVATAGTLAEAREVLKRTAPDIALVDQILPDGNGLEILRQLESEANTATILITANANVQSAIEALRLRVRDYFVKPIDFARLKVILAHVRYTRELESEISGLRSTLLELGRFGPLTGSSPAMQEVYELIRKVAPADVPVLITGETGTGKELVATALHGFSVRREKPFRAVNCGAMAPSLIESELFGHEQGSFTGATRQHKGLFQQATGGILFLDEVVDMPLELQVKLLRVLETGVISRVGGEQPVAVDVRVLAATNRDPETAVAAGTFRADLFYRLNVFRIRLPPLRERESDAEILAGQFLGQLNKANRTKKRFGPGVAERLREYSWPGNVRELKNLIQHAWIVSEVEIPASAFSLANGKGEAAAAKRISLNVGTPLSEADRQLILATLEDCGGDKRKAAEVLGISLKTLYNRLERYAQ